MKKKYDFELIVNEGIYQYLIDWAKKEYVIYNTIEVELLTTYKIEFKNITYKQLVFLRRLKKIIG